MNSIPTVKRIIESRNESHSFVIRLQVEDEYEACLLYTSDAADEG